MAKKKGFDWDNLVYVVPFTGLIAMIGATMAIFGVPYGAEIAQVGVLWFTVSLIIAVLCVAVKEEGKKKKKGLGK